MDSRASAASATLRRFAVALKTSALYPPPSPVTDRALAELLNGLHRYIEAHGPFAVRVSRRSFRVDEATFKDVTSASLAFHLYARKVIGLTVLAGVTMQEVATFLAIVRQDRAQLEASGGIASAVRRAGVQTIRVTEIALATGAAPLDESWGALWDLMDDGHELTAEHSQLVVDILRSGPGAIGGLFEQLRAMLGNAVDEHHLDWSQTLHDVVKTLDRVIAGRPGEDRQRFYRHLAAAILLLEDPIRLPLQRTLTARGTHDEMARALLDHLSEQRLVGLVPRNALDEGVPDDVAAPDPEMQILQAQRGASAIAGTAVTLPTARGLDETPLQAIRTEAGATDEASVAREVIGTLVDLFRHQADEAELLDTIRSLEEYLPWLVGQEDFGRLGMVLQGLKDGAAVSPAHEQAVAHLLDGPATGRLFHALVENLWASRGTPVEEPIRHCLVLMGDRVVRPLITLLAEEPRAGTRRMLCDVVVSLARDRTDDVGVRRRRALVRSAQRRLHPRAARRPSRRRLRRAAGRPSRPSRSQRGHCRPGEHRRPGRGRAAPQNAARRRWTDPPQGRPVDERCRCLAGPAQTPPAARTARPDAADLCPQAGDHRRACARQGQRCGSRTHASRAAAVRAGAAPADPPPPGQRGGRRDPGRQWRARAHPSTRLDARTT